MPLSRLSPRRGKNTLTRQKQSHSGQADNQRHLYLWTAIRKTRDELEQWQRQEEQVNTLFSQHIAPRERELTKSTCDVTEQLVEHFADRQLDIPDQSLLGLWVTDNLTSLQDHPFGDTDRIHALTQQWLEILNHDGPIENQLARLARKHSFNTNSGLAYPGNHDDDPASRVDNRNRDATANMERELHEDADHGPDADDMESPEIAADSKRVDGSEADTSTVSHSETIDSLEQKLSVERLFRQLAKVLHPDREQDEEKKAAKDVLMSECLKARQDKDINALLALYCEHVGELPDDLNNNSHQELVDALERQLKELQQELRQKRFGDPLHTLIVERYSASSNEECELRIKNHAHSLDAEINAALILTKQLGNQEGLLDALDERRSVEQDRIAINELTGY